ncbi:hypothetical protein [Duganella sp. HH105]|uniref:hypothetical protein n=1 Tax=Duganella sp. HH105 TaxID=1781067 RepID=UPI000877B426|nr:hypothetical protein [Duganella sp. HH105]
MNENMSREQYLESVRSQVAQTAQAMLADETSYILGARKLDSLRHEISGMDRAPDFMVFVAIVSETDGLPVDAMRENWDGLALDKLQSEIDAAEAWAKSHAEFVCAKLLTRFS